MFGGAGRVQGWDAETGIWVSLRKCYEIGAVTGKDRQTAPARELILANHRFPGEYIVKAFGPGSPEFRRLIRSCAVEVMGEKRVATSERATRSGHKICITLKLAADTVEEVEQVYYRVCGVPGLMFLL